MGITPCSETGDMNEEFGAKGGTAAQRPGGSKYSTVRQEGKFLEKSEESAGIMVFIGGMLGQLWGLKRLLMHMSWYESGLWR